MLNYVVLYQRLCHAMLRYVILCCANVMQVYTLSPLQHGRAGRSKARDWPHVVRCHSVLLCASTSQTSCTSWTSLTSRTTWGSGDIEDITSNSPQFAVFANLKCGIGSARAGGGRAGGRGGGRAGGRGGGRAGARGGGRGAHSAPRYAIPGGATVSGPRGGAGGGAPGAPRGGVAVSGPRGGALSGPSAPISGGAPGGPVIPAGPVIPGARPERNECTQTQIMWVAWTPCRESTEYIAHIASTSAQVTRPPASSRLP